MRCYHQELSKKRGVKKGEKKSSKAICLTCGQVFQPYNSIQKYCGSYGWACREIKKFKVDILLDKTKKHYFYGYFDDFSKYRTWGALKFRFNPSDNQKFFTITFLSKSSSKTPSRSFEFNSRSKGLGLRRGDKIKIYLDKMHATGSYLGNLSFGIDLKKIKKENQIVKFPDDSIKHVEKKKVIRDIDKEISADRNKININLKKKIDINNKNIIRGIDIDNFLRCPYRYKICKEENLNPTEFLKPAIKEIVLKGGIKFENEVMSKFDWKKTDLPLNELMNQKVIIKHPLLIKDHDGFQLVGQPDMIVPIKQDETTIYVPVDIKNHKKVNKFDILRLTFYSFLLKEVGRDFGLFFGIGLPSAFVILNDGSVEKINSQDYMRLLRDILFDMAKEEKLIPKRTSECKTCDLQETCLKNIKAKEGLTFLYRVGAVKEEKLKSLGIKKMSDLLDKRNEKILNALNLQKTRLYASAVINNEIYQIANFNLPTEKIIYLDIETDFSRENVWLIGVLKEDKFKYFYAETFDKEKKIVKEFLNFLKKHEDYNMFTYSGTAFDYNTLLKIAKRHNLDYKLLEKIKHYDVCQLVRNCFILPTFSYGLKELGKVVGYPFRSDLDGLSVVLAYLSKLETKKEIDPTVFEYNEDDVRAVKFLVDFLNEGKFKTKVLAQKKITMDKEYHKIMALRNKGIGWAYIADKLGKSVSYVYTKVKGSYGYNRKIQKKYALKKERGVDLSPEEVRKLMHEGYTYQNIADKYNRSLYYVYSRAITPTKKINIKKRFEDDPKNNLNEANIALIRGCYEQYGYLRKKRDKRYPNTFDYEIRLKFEDEKLMTNIRNILCQNSFSVGNPYRDRNRMVLTLYGKENAKRFIQVFKPRIKNEFDL